MACLRHSYPSRVILGLLFRQDTGELVTQHKKKKLLEVEIQFWVGKWIGEDFYFIMKTQKKIQATNAQATKSSIQENKEHSSYPGQLNLSDYARNLFFLSSC